MIFFFQNKGEHLHGISNENLKVALLETKNTSQIENGSLDFIETLHKQ